MRARRFRVSGFGVRGSGLPDPGAIGRRESASELVGFPALDAGKELSSRKLRCLVHPRLRHAVHLGAPRKVGDKFSHCHVRVPAVVGAGVRVGR